MPKPGLASWFARYVFARYVARGGATRHRAWP
jgi:hypothetical protein